MAANVINWSSLFNGQILTLDLYDPLSNPNGDVLRFDDSSISAAELWYLEANDTLTVVTITVGFKSVTFNVDGLTVTTSNITFADGSVLLVGDNLYGTGNDNAGNTLVGGSGDDQLIGLGGNDSLAGGAGTDVFVDSYGNNTLVGGTGDDFFDVFSEVGSANTVTGGTGRDFYYLDEESPGLLAAPGSPGHDYLVTDFAAGAGGDEIYVFNLVEITIGYTDQDPFAAGFLQLVQSGSNTLFQGDRDGAAGGTHTWMNLITLQNVTTSSLVSENFSGLFIGTAGDDLLSGSERADLMPGLLGNDTLSGAGGNDYISGAEGNDRLNGGRGADYLIGGFGNDTYFVDDALDVVVEVSNAVADWIGSIADGAVDGITDTVEAAIDYSLQNLANVENLTLSNDPAASTTGTLPNTGTGNELGNVLTGNDLSNTLTGVAGNDTLDGGAGADTLSGGLGDDTYFADAMDTLLENSGQGTDSVQIALEYAASFTLSADFENVTLTGSAYSIANGNGAANLMVGNLADNDLYGEAGNDTMDGGAGADWIYGGTGADWLYGGTEDDIFYVDGQADLVFENPGEGTDTVISSTSFYLYAGIEKLILASGAGDIFGSANELDNTLTGNEGVNLLLGWDGADTVSGGGGNDVVYGVNGNDSLVGDVGIDVLVAGEGNDTLDGGSDPDLLFGENGNDVLYGGTGFFTDILVGGAGEDVLDGSASSVSGQTRNEGDYDLMYGGTDNDTYQVDTPFDLTFETEIDGGGGTDTVIADITGAGYYLYADVENLELRGNTPFGVGNELNNTLTGNSLTNFLLGGAGDDTINGKAGNDVLFGESGADTFVFERGTGGDVVGDFAVGVDKLKLLGVGYTGFDQLTGHMLQDGAVMAIDLGEGDLLVLHNVTIASLSEGDFIFG